MKYSTTGKCCRLRDATACQGGMAPTLLRQGYGGQEAGGGLIEAALPDATKKGERPKSSRERRAAKKGK